MKLAVWESNVVKLAAMGVFLNGMLYEPNVALAAIDAFGIGCREGSLVLVSTSSF